MSDLIRCSKFQPSAWMIWSRSVALSGLSPGSAFVFGDEIEDPLCAAENVRMDGGGIVEVGNLRHVAGNEIAPAVNSPESGSASPAAMRRKVDLPEPLRPTSPMCSPSLKAMVAPSSTTWVPYFTERLFALAMIAPDVSAMGTSKVERGMLNVQSKRAGSGPGLGKPGRSRERYGKPGRAL